MYWSKDFAYVTGLIATDGCLSNDGRHIDFTSKDYEQIMNVKNILNLNNKVGQKYRGYDHNKFYYRIQFGNIKLYNFFLTIGLTPNKSKTIGALDIPNAYFGDYLRGNFDGDGYSYSYWDKRWKSSFLFYIGFCSASKTYLDWINKQIKYLYKIEGHIKTAGKSAYQLVYAKNNSLVLVDKMYHPKSAVCLQRKKFKIDKSLGIIYGQAGMLKLVNRHA